MFRDVLLTERNSALRVASKKPADSQNKFRTFFRYNFPRERADGTPKGHKRDRASPEEGPKTIGTAGGSCCEGLLGWWGDERLGGPTPGETSMT